MRPMRRSDRQMSEERAREVLGQCEYGILNLQSEDAYPYGVPISFALEGNAIFMHCALEGKKVDQIKKNPKASITVVGATEVLAEKFSTAYESVMAFGSVDVVTEESEKLKGLMALVGKYSPEFQESGAAYAQSAFQHTLVLKLNIENMTGKERMK